MQPRIMCASFNGDTCTTIYPANASNETDIIIFNELSSLARHITKYNVLTIGEDINAQIRKDKNNKFCLHNSSNSNEEYLTDFSLENMLACFNTKFQKREGKLLTYTNPNDVKSQQDYKQEVDK